MLLRCRDTGELAARRERQIALRHRIRDCRQLGDRVGDTQPFERGAWRVAHLELHVLEQAREAEVSPQLQLFSIAQRVGLLNVERAARLDDAFESAMQTRALRAVIRLALYTTPRRFDFNRFITQHRTSSQQESVRSSTRVFVATNRALRSKIAFPRRETIALAKRFQSADARAWRCISTSHAVRSHDGAKHRQARNDTREICTFNFVGTIPLLGSSSGSRTLETHVGTARRRATTGERATSRRTGGATT